MIVFFRNDDVNILDTELKEMTEIFINENIPITQAVEPANVTEECKEWLLECKKKAPNLHCIIQHGYDHQDRIIGKGEFGGRSYEDQFDDIQKGKEILEESFGMSFFPAFTCPRHFHNKATIKCMDNLSFKVFSSGFGLKRKHKMFYAFGHLLKSPHLLDKHISYHMGRIPRTQLMEISMSMSPIKKYFGMEECTFASISELQDSFNIASKQTNVIGITLHHRYHKSDSSKQLLIDLIQFLKNKNCSFSTIEKIYEGKAELS